MNFTCYEVVVFMKAVAHLSKNSLQSFRLRKAMKLSASVRLMNLPDLVQQSRFLSQICSTARSPPHWSLRNSTVIIYLHECIVCIS